MEDFAKAGLSVIRFFDVFFSMLGLVCGFPVLLVIYVIGLFDTGAPLFRQERVGRNKKPFILVKFRTMRVGTASVASHLAATSSVTPLGAILRRTKLDELPQLWNVLKGDMSLVGPRPLLMEYLPLYSPEQYRRHETRPGVTGWAQVNGRNALSWEDKFKLDIWYVDNQSIWLDIKIVFLTVKKVLIRDGISADGEMTMPKFQGTNLK